MAGAPLSTRFRTAPSPRGVGEWLLEHAGIQSDRWTQWTPVALGLGCALYFALPRESQLSVAWLLLAVATALMTAALRWHGSRVLTTALMPAACAQGGFAVAS